MLVRWGGDEETAPCRAPPEIYFLHRMSPYVAARALCRVSTRPRGSRSGAARDAETLRSRRSTWKGPGAGGAWALALRYVWQNRCIRPDYLRMYITLLLYSKYTYSEESLRALSLCLPTRTLLRNHGQSSAFLGQSTVTYPLVIPAGDVERGCEPASDALTRLPRCHPEAYACENVSPRPRLGQSCRLAVFARNSGRTRLVVVPVAIRPPSPAMDLRDECGEWFLLLHAHFQPARLLRPCRSRTPCDGSWPEAYMACRGRYSRSIAVINLPPQAVAKGNRDAALATHLA